MIIHSLSVSGFKMIGDPIRIEFPEEGRIGIFGRNESGKSTLLESIEYALYGLRRGKAPGATREDVVTWGRPKANMTVEFTSGENRYLLEREIGSKSGHQARLYVMLNGQKELITRHVGTVEREIERITGMDRDTFTKLVFIKQKDLDALKKLSKASREQLVNRVMGMEVFDESMTSIKDDLKRLKEEKKNKDIEFEGVKNNKEAYEEKVEKKKGLVKENRKLETKLKRKKKALDAKKEGLGKYDWLSKKISNKNLLQEMKKALKKDEDALVDLGKLKEQIETQAKAMEKYKPKVEHLEGVASSYRQLEGDISRLESEIKEGKSKKDEEISKSGLSPEEIKDLTPDLPARKARRMTYFVLSLLAGLVLLVVGFLVNLFVIALSVIIFLASGLFFRSYQRLDRISGLHVNIQAITQDIESKKDRLGEMSTSFSSLKKTEGYESSEEVGREIEGVLSTVKAETGSESIQGLKELLKNNRQRALKLEREKLDEKVKETKQKITRTKAKLKSLEKSKPEGVDKVRYTEKRHEKAKIQFEKVQKEHADIKEPYDGNKREIKVLGDEIKRLKPDYDRFSVLEKEVERLKKDVEVRQRVALEIKETSKELRSKVLPIAGFIINRILPTITDGRYSDLEITEDLKFKVHSMEAGKYKEREVFSGGTQDQFLIALRLAFTESILDSRVKADYYSLLMDECISSSDEVRKQGIFEVLNLMKKTFRQLFIIAHEDISDVVDHHLILTRNARGYMQIRSKSW